VERPQDTARSTDSGSGNGSGCDNNP
jgi:hypothetical protein